MNKWYNEDNDPYEAVLKIIDDTTISTENDENNNRDNVNNNKHNHRNKKRKNKNKKNLKCKQDIKVMEMKLM